MQTKRRLTTTSQRVWLGALMLNLIVGIGTPAWAIDEPANPSAVESPPYPSLTTLLPSPVPTPLTPVPGAAHHQHPAPLPSPTDPSPPNSGPQPASQPASQPSPAAAAYVCPMHPEVTSDKPGDCPKCGMHLVPIHKDSGND